MKISHQMVDLFDESEILLDFLAEDDSVKEELIEKLEELDKRMTMLWDDLAIVWTLWQ